MQDVSKMEALSAQIGVSEMAMIKAERTHLELTVAGLKLKSAMAAVFAESMVDAKGKAPSDAAVERAIKGSDAYIKHAAQIASAVTAHSQAAAVFAVDTRMYDIHMAAN